MHYFPITNQHSQFHWDSELEEKEEDMLMGQQRRLKWISTNNVGMAFAFYMLSSSHINHIANELDPELTA